MPISITVTGARGAATKLAKLKTDLQGGAKSISVATIKRITAVVALHDTRNFRAMQQERAQSKISLPEAIFSRVNNYVGGENGSVRRIEAKVDRLLPLQDTNRLYNSISSPNSPDIRVAVTIDAIRIENLVPYAPKHMSGIALVNISVYDLFEFGALEQQRLKERVPPPPLKGTRPTRYGKRTQRQRDIVRPAFYEKTRDKVIIHYEENERTGQQREVFREKIPGSKKLLFQEEEAGDLKSSRPYYRLYNWAKNKYPTTGALPKRNWIVPLPPEIVQSIGNMILLDLMERNGL